MTRHGRKWNAEEDAQLTARYGREPPSGIASSLGRTIPAIWQRALVLGLMNSYFRRTPSREQYRALLRDECRTSGVSYPQALSRVRRPELSIVRWRVFRDLRAMDFSLPGIASAAGFDHTSVRYGIECLNARERTVDK